MSEIQIVLNNENITPTLQNTGRNRRKYCSYHSVELHLKQFCMKCHTEALYMHNAVKRQKVSYFVQCSVKAKQANIGPPTHTYTCYPNTKQQCLWLLLILYHSYYNNNNNNRIQRRYSRFFTISSQRRELSSTHTLKWSGRNHVQIMCNTSSAYHVQVSCYVPLGTKGQLSY